MNRSTFRWLAPVLVALAVVAVIAALLLSQGGARTNPTPQAVVPNPTSPAATTPAQAAGGATTAAAVTTPAVAQATAAASGGAGAAQTTLAASGAGTTAAATAGAGTYKNPILTQDFADPFVMYVKGVYYAFATNASGRNIQVATSTDLLTWELQIDAMPALPTWAKPGGSLVWAPEVIAVGDKYNLYYTARDKASNKQCVGVAVSDQPEGRYKDNSDKPLVCQAEEGGTIDASPFRDGNKLYLYYKNDGNCCSITTYLYAQEMAPDGLSLTGTPVRLVKNDASWEGHVVEAPTMIKRDNAYYLFFSGNNYAGLEYAVGYATCKTALGPCEDAPENPILKTALTSPPVIGPGHQHVMQIGADTWMFYHAWEVSGGIKTTRRFMWIDRVTWKDGKPLVQGPTQDPQPAPKAKP